MDEVEKPVENSITNPAGEISGASAGASSVGPIVPSGEGQPGAAAAPPSSNVPPAGEKNPAIAPAPVPVVVTETPKVSPEVSAPVPTSATAPTAAPAITIVPASEPATTTSASAPAASAPANSPQSFFGRIATIIREKIFARREKRLQKILDYVSVNGKITNAEARKLLRVSDATAGRYFDILEKRGEIRQMGKKGYSHYVSAR